MNAVKRYNIPVISSSDAIYSMTNIISTIVCYMKVVKRVNPMSSHHKEFFSIYLISYLYEMIDVF